jgi:ubiquinone/menaquinone biosynthesis C-methylase UbiE
VLDAGCGMGDVARYQARAHGLVVSGIDILDFNIAEATARSEKLGLSDKTSFQVGDYHEIPFAESTFDGAYTMETFVHSADPAKALSEFYRVLKPGGRMVMFEYSRTPDESLSPQACQALAEVCEIAAMPAWLRLYDGELERLLTQARFTVESMQDVTDKILPMLQVFSTLGKVPYAIARMLNKREKAINAMSGVELYRHQDAWRYRIYTATKPRV